MPSPFKSAAGSWIVVWEAIAAEARVKLEIRIVKPEMIVRFMGFS